MADKESHKTELEPDLSPLLRLALEALPDGVSVHGATGELAFANDKMLQLYGGGGTAAAGDSDGPFDTKSSASAIEEALATGRAIEMNEALSAGDSVYDLSLRPLLDEGGAVIGFMRVARDVSGERRSQKQLLKAEQFATLGQMINGIAHDIGTPLNIISGYCEYLMMRAKPDSAGYSELSTILQQTKRIAEFIRQMLDLARPAQGRTDAIEVKSFLLDSVELISHHLRKADVKATLSCKISPPLIYGDAPRLRQAFFNLLLNSCQKLGAGGRIEIVVDEAEGRPGFMKVSVYAEDAAGKALDFAGAFPGFLSRGEPGETLGLGLSLARDIFDRFGAKIESQWEGGPLVVYLPVNNLGKPSGR